MYSSGSSRRLIQTTRAPFSIPLRTSSNTRSIPSCVGCERPYSEVEGTLRKLIAPRIVDLSPAPAAVQWSLLRIVPARRMIPLLSYSGSTRNPQEMEGDDELGQSARQTHLRSPVLRCAASRQDDSYSCQRLLLLLHRARWPIGRAQAKRQRPVPTCASATTFWKSHFGTEGESTRVHNREGVVHTLSQAENLTVKPLSLS